MAEMRYCPLCGKELINKNIDERERSVCTSDSCGYVFWDNPIPVVAAIVEHDDNIILVRNMGWPEKMYGLVSGFLERGETPEDGIIREIKEELALSGKIKDFVGVYSFFQMNQIIFVYHVIAEGSPQLGDELADFKRVSPDKLMPWPIGTGPAVKDWLERRGSVE